MAPGPGVISEQPGAEFSLALVSSSVKEELRGDRGFPNSNLQSPRSLVGMPRGHAALGLVPSPGANWLLVG